MDLEFNPARGNQEDTNLFVASVARICHETNRLYCQSIGDNSQPSWEDAPAWQRESAINGVSFVFDQLNRGLAVKPSHSHVAWLADKERDGWKYGPVKDAEKKEHPCMVHYNHLPFEQRMKDYLFQGVCTAFWNCQAHEAIRKLSEMGVATRRPND